MHFIIITQREGFFFFLFLMCVESRDTWTTLQQNLIQLNLFF